MTAGGRNRNMIDLVLELKRETEKGICVNDGGDRDVWLPKSLVEFQKLDEKDGNLYTVTLPEHLAIEKELI